MVKDHSTGLVYLAALPKKKNLYIALVSDVQSSWAGAAVT